MYDLMKTVSHLVNLQCRNNLFKPGRVSHGTINNKSSSSNNKSSSSNNKSSSSNNSSNTLCLILQCSRNTLMSQISIYCKQDNYLNNTNHRSTFHNCLLMCLLSMVCQHILFCN